MFANYRADLYPGSVHVSEVGLAASPDRAIWAHARDHGLVIVTKDENFHRLSVLLGPPPKVMLGNCSTDDVVRLLQVALPLDCYRTRASNSDGTPSARLIGTARLPKGL